MKRFIIVQSDKEFYTSHSGLALVGLCINELCSLLAKAREAFPISDANNGIGLDDILRSYLGLLAMGQSDFEAITNRKGDDYFKESLSIGRIPSAETLRQRLDEVATALRPLADGCMVEFLRKAQVKITPLETGHVPLDCDVFPMDNSKTKKEGVSRIYNGQDGYPAKRRRIKTVMQELIYLAARLVKTGRRLKLIFSRHCPGFGAFQALYLR